MCETAPVAGELKGNLWEYMGIIEPAQGCGLGFRVYGY